MARQGMPRHLFQGIYMRMSALAEADCVEMIARLVAHLVLTRSLKLYLWIVRKSETKTELNG